MTDSTINRFLMSGTNAERLAHTPDLATPASGPDPSVIWKETDTGNTYMWDFGGAAWQQVNGGLADADYGDIVVSSGVWSVDNNAVTYAKMQDVSVTSRILGRKTSGPGDPEECSLSDVLDFIGSAAQGDILYRGSSGWSRLGAGASGNVLTTGGTGADPSWTTPASTSPRGCVAYKSATQTGLNLTTSAAISWDSEAFDTDSIHDNVTNNTRLTVPSGVSYVRITAGIWLANVTASNGILCFLKKNGAFTAPGLPAQSCSASFTNPGVNLRSALLSVSAGDYFEVFLQLSSDTSVDVSASLSFFEMQIVS